jgi:hypothetical protein
MEKPFACVLSVGFALLTASFHPSIGFGKYF